MHVSQNMSITAFLCSPNMFLYAFILYIHLNINVKSRWGTVPSQNNGEEKQNSTDIKHKKGGEDQERMHDSKKEHSFPKSGPWNTISRFFIYFLESRTPSASAETRTDDTQQTENIRAGVVFVLQMYACPFWEKRKVKLLHIFFLKLFRLEHKEEWDIRAFMHWVPLVWSDSKLRSAAGVTLQ